MAILSFAHLKQSRQQAGPQTVNQVASVLHSSGVVVPVQSTKAVMSFAHLKAKAAPAPTQPSPPVLSVRLQRPRGIGIMKTALLAATNYCEGCPRFWPSDENEKRMGVPYGRCWRSTEGEHEVWRSIPLTARVAKCWYHMNHR